MVDNSELLELHTNQRLLIEEMQSRGINVNIIYKEIELIKAEYENHIEWILDRDSSITPYSVSIICGDKYITKKILQRSEISVPTREMFYPNEAQLSIFYARKIGFPVVIKPVFGSHGDHIYMDVENEKEQFSYTTEKQSIEENDVMDLAERLVASVFNETKGILQNRRNFDTLRHRYRLSALL